MNAVSTIQLQCVGKNTKPTPKDAASAAAICSAMRVDGDGRIALGARGRAESSSTSTGAAIQPMRRPSA